MAEHVGRRQRRRQRSPPLVLENPAPTLIPEEAHTSPFKGGNTNSAEKVRKAPPGVPLKEKTVHKLTEQYKCKTNEVANLGNREVVRLLNLAGDKRCASYSLQAMSQTRHVVKSIQELNAQALSLANSAEEKSNEVAALGARAYKVPKFYFNFPVLSSV